MTIRIEIYPPLAGASGGQDPSIWEEEVATGETLGRLLARLAVERPGFTTIYNATTRRLADGIRLAVNGRNYELIGGLTYYLAHTDRLSFSREEA